MISAPNYQKLTKNLLRVVSKLAAEMFHPFQVLIMMNNNRSRWRWRRVRVLGGWERSRININNVLVFLRRMKIRLIR